MILLMGILAEALRVRLRDFRKLTDSRLMELSDQLHGRLYLKKKSPDLLSWINPLIINALHLQPHLKPAGVSLNVLRD